MTPPPSRVLHLWNPGTSAWEPVGDARLSTHLTDPDAHTYYLTSAEADTLFLTQSEGDARYAAIGGGGGGAMATDALWDAKGDLAVGSGGNAGARLPAGTDGQVLTLDSAQTLGVKWATPAGGGAYVDEAGDTMSGTLAFSGAAVASGGAIRVTGSSAPPTSRRLYGPGGATFSPTATVSGEGFEYGLRFTSVIAQKLVAVRWYRASPATAAPAIARLWDTTTALVVWSEASPAEWTSSTLGWLEHPVPAGTQPTLVAGRDYVLSYGVTNFVNNHTGQNGYVPVPEADLTFVGHRYGSSAGAYPSNTHTYAFGIDGGFLALAALAALAAASDPAASGAIRLPNATEGAIAWRNAADTADLALTVSAADALTFNGSALLTQAVADPLYLSPTEGDAAYLKLTGGALTGALTVAATSGNALEVKTGAAPGTTRLQVAQTGTVTLTPDAGQIALAWDNGRLSSSGVSPQLSAFSGANIALYPTGGIVHPAQDNTTSLGIGALRWTAVYAVAGAINTSLAEAKQAITPLAPEDALAAVRATDPVLFDYRPPERGPEWYELPDDPEQAAQVLEQRMRSAPLEEGARHQAGFVLHDESGTYQTDPLFETGEGQSNAANSVGVLLAAIKQLDARLSAVEGV